MSAGSFLIADHLEGRLFACIAESRFTEPAVAATRMGASLHPFPDQDAARAALEAAGGTAVRRA